MLFYFVCTVKSITPEEIEQIAEISLIQLRQHLANQRVIFNQRLDKFRTKLNEENIKIKDAYASTFSDLSKLTEGYNEIFNNLKDIGKSVGVKKKYIKDLWPKSYFSAANQPVRQVHFSSSLTSPIVSKYRGVESQIPILTDPFKEKKSFEVSGAPGYVRRRFQ
ncbi:hypothetical protein TUBRATIS_11720 [Tubulinosema ratisbonensis]|uniref:Uncharacterized protein n=1 Tax=Tubulinosema ratisbonensis TaxID=291195 RepID=A0A437AMF5_9MICR|nr:hypothetical protein TUBRATIS_11720 [Tubulinosema ratisbonensis]